MTERQRFIYALERKPLKGLVPHFELVFFLTMEAFGKLHQSQRCFHQWIQMSKTERELHIADIAKLYIQTAEHYHHSAIFVHQHPAQGDMTIRLLTKIRELSGDRYFIMMHGDGTFGIPSGSQMEEFAYRIADEPEKLHDEARKRVDSITNYIGNVRKHEGLLDGVALCSDYCFNNGPFLSPSQFGEFVTPYLEKEIERYRDMGLYVIKHTDGNIMPIIDQMIECNPHALHSLDPQAGIDIAIVKRLYGDKICLIGNVDCGLMQTGTDEEVADSVRYALKHGMPGGGYIFSTSNCIYTGMPLEHYHLMIDIWQKEGIYA